jgi:hypothetical protein
MLFCFLGGCSESDVKVYRERISFHETESCHCLEYENDQAFLTLILFLNKLFFIVDTLTIKYIDDFENDSNKICPHI